MWAASIYTICDYKHCSLFSFIIIFIALIYIGKTQVTGVVYILFVLWSYAVVSSNCCDIFRLWFMFLYSASTFLSNKSFLQKMDVCGFFKFIYFETSPGVEIK